MYLVWWVAQRAGWRTAAGVGPRHRQAHRAFQHDTAAAPACVHDTRNERKWDVQLTRVEETWGREKEKMACEGV